MGGGQYPLLNKKGFTLIELLAVIIILGILLLITIPSVTEYITTSRKKTYVEIANKYVEGAIMKVNSLEYPFTALDTTYYVHINNIRLEKGGKSPFGEWKEAYVVVTFDGDSYSYYWTSIDEAGYGVKLTSINELDHNKLMSKISQIDNRLGIGLRSKIYIIESDGSIEEATANIELSLEEADRCFVYTINNNVVTIDSYRDGCSKDVIIPAKIGGHQVTAIGTHAFRIKGINSVIIPNGIISIGEQAFNYNNITELRIPSSVTTIGIQAFANNKLTAISLSSSVTSLGGGAFSNNAFPEESALIYSQKLDGSPDYSKVIGYAGTSKDLVIPNEVEGVKVKTIANSAFRFLDLTSVVLPSNLETIEDFAFDDNKLTSINLPNGLKTIGLNAFRSNKITSLTIPSSVISLGRVAFNNNQLPESDAFIYKRNSNGTIDYSTIVSYGGANRNNVVIPENKNGVILRNINEFAFSYNGITKVTIPSTVTFIGRSSFRNNQLPANQAFIYKRTTSGIDYSTLVSYDGAERNNVVIPGTVNGVDLKVIDTDAFTENRIKKVTIPNTVTTIKSNAFLACRLTEIVIPESVMIIEANAFRKEMSWEDFNLLTKIVNKTGRSFDWKSITGSNYEANFVTGTIRHQVSNIEVVSE